MTPDPGTQGCTGLSDGAAMPDNSPCMSLPPQPARTPSSYNIVTCPRFYLYPSIHPPVIHPSINPSFSHHPPAIHHPLIHSFIHSSTQSPPFIHPSTHHSFSHPSIPNLPQSLHCQAYYVSFSPTLFIINCNLPKAGGPAQPKAKNLTCNSRASH